jgi:hypothetical protein
LPQREPDLAAETFEFTGVLGVGRVSEKLDHVILSKALKFLQGGAMRGVAGMR